MKRALILFLLAPAVFAEPYTKNVAIVVFNGVEVLDLAAPAEVFAAASQPGANGVEPAFNVYTVGSTRSSIESQGFLDITPDYSIKEAPTPHILILPGGAGSMNAMKDTELMKWIRSAGAGADSVLTICYGAFIAGHAGMLDGLDVTTWYGSVAMLQDEFPTARVHTGRRFIDNGKVITTAGVSAGLDGSLHLVAKTLGRYVADRTAEYMEYPWAPQSHTSVTYAQLNPRLDARGRKLQEAAIARRAKDAETAVTIYRDLISKSPADDEAWFHLGNVLHAAKRHTEAIDAYLHAIDGKSRRAAALYNLAGAYAVTGQKEKAIETAARAVEAGYRSKVSFDHDPDFASIREDERFKELLAKL